MKKLSLILALVFVGSFVMAQQLSFVGQNGVGNTAAVTQSGAQGNNSWINLVGNTNDALVNQANDGFAGDRHNAVIDVTGNINTSSILQEFSGGGDAKITQIGNSNTAKVLENGNFYVDNPETPGFDAWAYQKGSGNNIEMTIYGTNSAAYANQVGDNNTIKQSLGQDVGNKVQDSRVFASQLGNGNTALQTTMGEGFAGFIKTIAEVEHIEQTGNGNWGQQMQYDGILPAHDNFESLIQNGNSNLSLQNQMGDNLKSIVTQNGGDNSTTVQIGSFNTVTVTQL